MKCKNWPFVLSGFRHGGKMVYFYAPEYFQKMHSGQRKGKESGEDGLKYFDNSKSDFLTLPCIQIQT